MKNQHFKIIKSLLQGYTMCRSFMDLEAETFNLKGEVLDAGSKSTNASYYKHIDTSNAKIIFSDINAKDNTILKLNFEEPLQVNSESFDTVIAMNLLEHIFNYHLFLTEVNRILRKGGMLVGCVPFLIPYHADPDDYFRYTHTTINKILKDAGFKNIEVNTIGEGGLLCTSDLLFTYYPNTSRIMYRLRIIHRLVSVLLYTFNEFIKLFKIGGESKNKGAYLALSFKAYKDNNKKKIK